MSLTSIILFFLILTLITLPISGIASPFNITLPGCPDKCGNISIPYPFGIYPGCYLPGFDLLCSNNSLTTPVLSMGPGNPNANILIQNINLTTGEANALQHINYRCFNQSNNVESNDTYHLNLKHFPAFLFSAKRNKFTVIGCYTLAYMNAQLQKDMYHAGCLSFCSGLNSTTNGPCDGRGCCQASIPKGLNFYNVQWGFDHNLASDFNPCNYAVLMEEDSYNLTVLDLVGRNFQTTNKGRVPFVLDWAIRSANDICLDSGDAPGISTSSASACLSQHSICYNTTNGLGYLCQCIEGFDGNPYIHDGCQDINECENGELYKCSGTCKNTYGSYDCKCPKGTEGDGKKEECNQIFPPPARVAIVSILVVAILVALFFLVNAYRQKKRYNKEKEDHRRYCEMMAGSLKAYTLKAITVATNNFDENLVIGKGGFGKVYKGILENKEVAIKKAKKLEGLEKEGIVKEIILHSQINHKNIVRILGCCLQEKIPMLVYEFVTKGSLFDLLHGKENKSIPLATRIKIGLGSAEALHYLHDSIDPSILHADVKSANILLNGIYTAKVCDFGASNILPIDDAEFISLVHWTRGYLDPECLSTHVITKSSDVYSFGVVLAELLTRKEAIYTDKINGINHLAASFVSMVNKNKMLEMLDKEIVSDDAMVIEILREVSELVLWCLSFKGDDRPTMKQVVEKLQSVVKLNPHMFNLEDKENLLDNSFPYGYKSPNKSTFHITGSSSVSQPFDGQFGTESK